MYTNCVGAISKDVKIPGDLTLVKPINLGAESLGSAMIPAVLIVTVAIPRPSVTTPVTVTPGPTKFIWVIEPIPAFPPSIFPSSLTVIPSSIKPGGIAVQYLCPGYSGRLTNM
jgi:hypothetical protein